MILVTAANGNQGKLLVPRLLAAGSELRACVRSEESARALYDAGVSEVVVGDIADPDVLIRAMRDIESVYHVGPTQHPKEREAGFASVDAAKAAGVQHFVFSSVLHAITTDLIQHEIKRDIEEHLISSGMEFTILQPANYMMRRRLEPVVREGVFFLSWDLDRYQSMVDLHDVAGVAEKVLIQRDPHLAATYELVAPGRYTAHDLARVISEVLGREVQAQRIESEVFLKAMLGTDDLSEFPYQLGVSRAISKRYSSHDFVGNPNVLTWLLGRTPTTYEQFLRRELRAMEASAQA